jgi:pyruvate/2-oxoglutarate dehydrogenase complex dihydrolipoamide dehydrogenase (E3) component
MARLPIALRAARHGPTAFAEKEKLGDTCLNRGCVPTKKVRWATANSRKSTSSRTSRSVTV